MQVKEHFLCVSTFRFKRMPISVVNAAVNLNLSCCLLFAFE